MAMKLEDVRQLWSISRQKRNVAAQELARADARRQDAEQVVASHKRAMARELERARDADLWPGLGSWHRAAEGQLHDLQAAAARLAAEAADARGALGAAAAEAERFKSAAADLAGERRAVAAKRVQQALDEAALRRRSRSGAR